MLPRLQVNVRQRVAAGRLEKSAASLHQSNGVFMTIKRHSILGMGIAAAAAAAMPWAGAAFAQVPAGQSDERAADYTLHINNGLIELAPDHIVSTTLYNGQFPGPLLRATEGQQVVVDIHNNTKTPALVHWHGQTLPSGRRTRSPLAVLLIFFRPERSTPRRLPLLFDGGAATEL
ncbi:multicopper oxidase domain-containing protein [Rhodopila sp.]|uniref:multicopper oxidase domain-containing protein n=1 Tax=Rhodopila sp. TaxID=2480087 RepID=UPI003D0DFD8F